MSTTRPSLAVTDGRTRQGRLVGPSRPLDRRVHAIRDDLADAALADRVLAPRYASAVPFRCVAPRVPLTAQPVDGASWISELLFGEIFDVLDVTRGWAWGSCRHDGYVGWVPAAALAVPDRAPSHRVVAPTAIVFTAPDIKSPARLTLPFGALLALEPAGPSFHEAGELGFLHHRHVAPLSAKPCDAVQTARSFVGAPYGWGGRTAAGIDCSGLVQMALMSAGVACPRDTDQQQASFDTVPFAARATGDLVFFPGHVGMLTDRDTLLHANAFWMSTLVEPLAAVTDRPGAARPLHVLGVGRPRPLRMMLRQTLVSRLTANYKARAQRGLGARVGGRSTTVMWRSAPAASKAGIGIDAGD